MDHPTFHRLLAPDGQAALAAAVALAPSEATLLACHQQLRKRFADDLVRPALETALLRRKATDKFSRAEQMYFTREGLEQSSGEVVAAYRAQRFAHFNRVGDLCCGIGGDLVGLAGVTNVVAVDADLLRLAMAAENLRAYDRADRVAFVAGDVLSVPLANLDAAFADPARRAGGRRHLRPDEYAPPLAALRGRFPKDFPFGVKVAPGVPWDDLRPLDAGAEFISVGGELKECCLWFGPLRTTGRRATVLPAGVTLAAEQPADPEPAGPPLEFLYDPDPAVVRSGLVADLGRLLGARPIDPDVAYLTADRHTLTPFARCYRVLDALPFHARRIGERLRALDAGPVTITKRGSAVDVDALRRSWKLTGATPRTVVLTRVQGRPSALIANLL